jgi:acyl-CoA hydrolase
MDDSAPGLFRRADVSAIDLTRLIRPGDRIVWGQGTGEPTTLIEALLAQRGALGGVSAFVGSAFSDLLQPDHADHVSFTSMGALGGLSRLARAGVLGIIPCHVGQIGGLIASGRIGCDVAMVQVSAMGPGGGHSYGLINDYTQAAVAKARVVIAEVNDQVPFSACDALLKPEQIHVTVATSRSLVELLAPPPGPVEKAIAAHVGGFIADGSVLQMGIGSVPDAVTRLIGDRRDLGVHSGMIGDGIWQLMASGVVTNARKALLPGVTVAGALIGSRGLYDFAHHNPALRLCDGRFTHSEAVLASIERLVTINSALEVDLTGQVNAEATGAAYMGGTGGQVDYVRGGSRAPGGHALIVLPATARGGTVSRIVEQLWGPVTTARSEVDVIITEHGAADLRGATLAERARRLVAIADPAFRDGLAEAAWRIAKRGF